MAKTIRRSATTDERAFRHARQVSRERRISARQDDGEVSGFPAVAAHYAAAFAGLSVPR